MVTSFHEKIQNLGNMSVCCIDITVPKATEARIQHSIGRKAFQRALSESMSHAAV
jgi:hypothetical protein